MNTLRCDPGCGVNTGVVCSVNTRVPRTRGENTRLTSPLTLRLYVEGVGGWTRAVYAGWRGQETVVAHQLTTAQLLAPPSAPIAEPHLQKDNVRLSVLKWHEFCEFFNEYFYYVGLT